MQKIILYFITFLMACLLVDACKVDAPLIDYENSGYPDEVADIVLTKCAVRGCHNDISKDAASGLSLLTWDKLFQGGRSGASVIPYNHEQSTFFMYINEYPDLGVNLVPRMPLYKEPLSREEVMLLRDWIDAGAPNKEGFVKFSDDPLRRKIYLTNQGCDLVAVFDATSGLIMRYVKVGTGPQIESPHSIHVSPDGKYWYVIFTGGNYMQKYNAIDDSFVDQVDISDSNPGLWNTFTISADSKRAFIADWVAGGRIFVIDLETMKILYRYQGGGLFAYPHGIVVDKTGKTFYVNAQNGSKIYKVNITDPTDPQITEIPLQATVNPVLLPHEIILSPDEKYLFITCQNTNEVRVVDRSNDSVVAIIPTAVYPQEMTLSLSRHYLFVSCMEETGLFAPGRGAVTIIDYTNFTVVKNIYTGYQPHGIVADDVNNRVLVGHRNTLSAGPAPHHVTECGGRNGYVTMIDLNTLTLLPNKKIEVSVDPYGMDIRK